MPVNNMPYKHFIIAVGFFVAATRFTHAQTLFTVNSKPVSKQEFLKAFNKNPDTSGNRSREMHDYLNMYINFKLKLQQAYDEKLENKEEFKDESNNFKKQLTENYINEQANINQLVHEAFNRSQKDILLAEVFVAPGNDTAAPYKKINDALNALKSGKSFDEVTAAYSTDESLKQNKGNMGYITVFTLPYDVENIVYALKTGEYSAIYHSAVGYHIFKNVSERPAAGKRKIQQILLPVTAAFTSQEKNAVKEKADSIYQLILKGASFDNMVLQFSSPGEGMQSMGMSTVGVGMYSNDFEDKVYSLSKPGEITRPFETGYGYHIIKLLTIEPVVTNENDVVNTAALQQRVESDDRLATAKSNLVNQWMTLTKYKKAAYNEKDLWRYTDSALATKNKVSYNGITTQTVLFSFAKQNVTVSNWLTYLQFQQQGKDLQKPYPVLMKEFTRQSSSDYYHDHIEDYNPSISGQMREFNEANLLFAVMDEHVWGKASQDTAALLNYYNQHKANYIWQPGISALVVTSADKTLLDSIALLIKANPADWRNITGTLATADSSRYETGQYPVTQNIPMQKGFLSTPEKNDGGDSYTFMYVFQVFPQQSQRSFDDAKGMVINDYQQVLEENWLKELKKKYVVKVNEDVVKALQ
ncbi:MAG TPA: peptidylprolyl isomerase [Chitinophagaceae bacterium]|nr:peptidylprolyl isomerase [Chitinophagaceae bacterium]